jgi:UDP-N-acetylglucosamine transferase subunit ALG13
MIFIATGTTNHAFNRLFWVVDKTLSDLKSRELLIVQSEIINYPWKYENVDSCSDFSYPEFINKLQEARVIICHGGAGTILNAVSCCQNKPFVVPRLADLNEHVSDHQVNFVSDMKKRGLIQTPDSADFTAELKEYLIRPVKAVRQKNSDIGSLIRNLVNYTETLNTCG